MSTPYNTLLDEVKCLGCASNSSLSGMIKLGLWSRISSAYSQVQSFVERSGITDATQIAAVLTLAESAVAHGWWGKCDLIYPFVGGTAGAHAQNLKSSSFTITWNGTVTHDANGITGDGLTGFGNTGYIPSSSGQISQNSAHYSIYKRSPGASFSRRYFGCASTVPNKSLACFNLNVNDFRQQINQQAGIGVLSILNGMTLGSRLDAASEHVFYAGVDNQVAVASTGIPTVAVYVMALNNNGATVTFSNANLAQLTVGSGITFAEYLLMAADWQAFQTALGRQV